MSNPSVNHQSYDKAFHRLKICFDSMLRELFLEKGVSGRAGPQRDQKNAVNQQPEQFSHAAGQRRVEDHVAESP